MSNNLFIDIGEINAALQDIATLKNQVNSLTSTLHGIQTDIPVRHWAAVYLLSDGHWKDVSSHNGRYHTLSLPISFTKSLYARSPVVNVAIEGNHPALKAAVSNVTSAGCTLLVHKSDNAALRPADRHGIKVHVSAQGI